jgi:carbon monoxide dehydrogenase subunit G
VSTPIELAGTEHYNATPEKVFDTVTNLDLMKDLIPDLVSAEKDADGSLRCVIKPGFAFVRGTLRTTIRLTESRRAESATLRVSASGIGMGMEIESKLRLSPEAGGRTRLDWTGAVTERKGLIAAVSPGLIRGAAEKTVKDGWEQLRRRVEA